MYGDFDHMGLLVRDLEPAAKWARETLGLPMTRTTSIPQFGIEAQFFGPGTGTLEIFTFADPALLEPRLAGAERRLDHTAFRVEDLDALIVTLRAQGARFSGPDRGSEITEPLELGGVRHVWTVPESTGGLPLQLSQRVAR